MSLQFILGGSGSGKSERLYQMLIEHSVTRPQDQILLIVPEQYTMQAQRHIVEKHPMHGVMNVDVLSFERLAWRVFDELGESQKEILDDVGKNMIIRRLLSKHEEDLFAFRGSIKKRGFVDQVKSMLSELLQYGITPDILKEKSADFGQSPVLYGKLTDICVIYEAFLADIRAKYMTTEEVPQRLCQVIEKSVHVRQSVIYMDNFTGFTPVQYRLMGEILALAPRVVMTLPVDVSENPYQMVDMEDLFYLTKDTICHLENICRERHIVREKDILLSVGNGRFRNNECLGALEQSIFRFGTVEKYAEKNNESIATNSTSRTKEFVARNSTLNINESGATNSTSSIKATSDAKDDEKADASIETSSELCMGDSLPIEACLLTDPRSEMKYVAMRIHALVSEGKYRYRDIAVVTADMERYGAYAQYWFAKYEIPCFFDGRRDVSSNMMVEWLRSLLDMMVQNFSYESVFRYLRCGLSGMERGHTDELENYVLAMGIRGLSRWQQEWTARQMGMSEEKLLALNNLKTCFIEPLVILHESVNGGETEVGTLIRAVYVYMQTLNIKGQLEKWQTYFEENGDLARGGEYRQIYDVMIALLERMYLILGNEKMSVKEFLDVLEAGLSDVRVGIIPAGMDQMTFGDIRRSRLDAVSVLFFVGMNDGIVPSVGPKTGLITDVERMHLAEKGLKLAPTGREDTCTEQFYLYANLTKPSKKLIMTCSSQDAKGNEMMPSTIIGQMQQIFPSLTIKRIRPEEEAFLFSDVKGMCGYVIDGLRESAEKGSCVSKQWQEAFDWFCIQPDYENKVAKLLDGAFYRYWEEKLSASAVRAVYDGKLTGGVTMLERYASCAYAHFAAYGLRLKEREIYQVQAPDIGLMFHQSIERFSLRLANSGYEWRNLPDEKREQLIEECVRSVAAAYNHAVMKDSSRAEYLTQKILRMASRTVWALQQQLKKGDFDPVGYELRFAMDLGVTEADGSEVELRGKIDRMDIFEADGKRYLKIIDYKTGKMTFDLSAVYYGLQLQLMVYMQAARETEGKRYQKSVVIPAGVLYYHIDDPLVQTESLRDFMGVCEETGSEGMKGEKLSESELQILEKLAVNGLVVDDKDILLHMDRKPNEAPKVLPIAFKKDGSLTATSGAAIPENFEILALHVKHKAKKLGQEILSGNIAVNPSSYGNKKACDYCKFKSLCGFDTGILGYHFRRMKKMKKDQVWESIAKEAGTWDLTGVKTNEQS